MRLTLSIQNSSPTLPGMDLVDAGSVTASMLVMFPLVQTSDLEIVWCSLIWKNDKMQNTKFSFHFVQGKLKDIDISLNEMASMRPNDPLLFQGERLSHALGCAFTACLQRKQKAGKVPESNNSTGSVSVCSITLFISLFLLYSRFQ